MKILSLTHDSQAEYRKRPSSFYTPLQRSASSPGTETSSASLMYVHMANDQCDVIAIYTRPTIMKKC